MSITAETRVGINSDNLVKVYVQRNSRTGAAPTTITSVTARILNLSGGVVSNSSINLTVDASDSRLYWGQFPWTMGLDNGAQYDVEVTATVDDKVTKNRTRFRARYFGQEA